jgi:hypothetical protein
MEEVQKKFSFMMQSYVTQVIKKACQKVKLLTVLSKAATVVGNTTTVAFYKIAIKTVEIINTITMDSVFEAATQPANRI